VSYRFDCYLSGGLGVQASRITGIQAAVESNVRPVDYIQDFRLRVQMLQIAGFQAIV